LTTHGFSKNLAFSLGFGYCNNANDGSAILGIQDIHFFRSRKKSDFRQTVQKQQW